MNIHYELNITAVHIIVHSLKLKNTYIEKNEFYSRGLSFQLNYL